MTNFIAAWHLRLAAKAVAARLTEIADVERVKVYADAESRDGYALVEFVATTPKGKLRTHKFALKSDRAGKSISLVKAGAYSIGETLYERRVPGDMVFPWILAVEEILSTYGSEKPAESLATLEGYAGEDGNGAYAHWHVPDLVPEITEDIRMVFLLESPHIEELKTGVPAVGEAGRLALAYLLSGQSNSQSLGGFVQASHAAGDGRFALLNVSNVPLQAAATLGSNSHGLSEKDWTLLEKVRVSDARTATSMKSSRANAVGRVLLNGLERRIDDLELAADSVIVAGGVCAGRFMRSFAPALSQRLLNVPHPARRQWLNDPDNPHLVEVRRLFLQHLKS